MITGINANIAEISSRKAITQCTSGAAPIEPPHKHLLTLFGIQYHMSYERSHISFNTKVVSHMTKVVSQMTKEISQSKIKASPIRGKVNQMTTKISQKANRLIKAAPKIRKSSNRLTTKINKLIKMLYVSCVETNANSLICKNIYKFAKIN
jgi:uncharacterized FlaG/YvyC family protein